ncbi:hypothetical protein M406DRAFT_323686 [Cryphonectria parasitica EP155]|uniref:Increased loss of mitochondrial DNA protein 1 n=1 Tax=Cryphonectria parasitica (strain ATCC 38755 / EP155) TaxID=660469 RepID=A0A9P4XXV2_CRYP1|nr:uncharacterized protein M406DRAFT_323686 [Cryphonectria parasitica EP155]KAF3762775.1 hypothetical protein M406DRAFT_323686 [Cryphonectria parasitica EP155]
MALISAKTILTSLSLFHITLGFFLLTNPGTIADQALVLMLGEATGMSYERSFEARSASLAFLGIVLGIWGFTDLVTLSMPEEISLIHHWGVQAPLRFLVSFLLLLYTFFSSSSSPFYRADTSRGWMSHPIAHAYNPNYQPSGWGGEELKNRVFFVFIFVETMSWLWAWVTLREDTRELMIRAAKRRGSQSWR